MAKRCLVIGADTLSRTIDKSEIEEYLLEELENEMLSEVGLN